MSPRKNLTNFSSGGVKKMTIGQVDMTEQYERHRIREPSEFVPGSLRTHDIGRPGFSKRIAGRFKRTGKWATQSLLISHQESVETKRKLRKQAKDLIRRS